MSNNYSIAQPHPGGADSIQKAALTLAALGLLVLLVAMSGHTFSHPALLLSLSLGGIITGTAIYAARKYLTQTAGIKNNGVWQQGFTSQGARAWLIGIFITGFYVLIYWFPQYLGLGGEQEANTGLVALFDPLSRLMNGGKASEWFMYGVLYTVAIMALGIKFMFKYRNNRYQLFRTSVLMFFQLVFAFIIPEILNSLKHVDASFNKDIKLFWPLNHEFFYGENLDAMRSSGALGMFFLVTGILLFAVFSPIITYFVGKRWYCSWVCGCGGLAETAGDPYRHLSSKRLGAWRIERWLIHSVLLAVTVMTAVVLYGYFSGSDTFLGLDIDTYFKAPYGFIIGAVFSGIVGVGFYPLLGNRVWCRFGCPMAAYIGLVQRFKSRFRITTNGGQCISCGNCSTYCEQGIDVRAYAQKGQDIVRASCVGCGICSAVCPRGVLKLENGPEGTRIMHMPELTGLNREK